MSQSRADELRAKLREKAKNHMFGGMDTEMMAWGTELAVFHLEAGVRKFSDLIAVMAQDLGTTPAKLKPYLRSWYNGARDMMEDHGLAIDGMDSPETVRAALADIGQEEKAKPKSEPQKPKSVVEKVADSRAKADSQAGAPYDSFEGKTHLLSGIAELTNKKGEFNKAGEALLRKKWEDMSEQEQALISDAQAQTKRKSDEYDAKVRQAYADAQTRRLEGERTIRAANGKPFKTEQNAQKLIDDNRLNDSHEAAQEDGGWVAKKLTGSQLQERENAKKGIASYTDLQERAIDELGLRDKVKPGLGLDEVLDQAQIDALDARVDYLQHQQRGMADPRVAHEETGEFGAILNQYRHDAQGAIEALAALQDGEAVAALHHPDVGDIDLVWGKAPSGKDEGLGLAKLLIKHPEVLSNFQGFISRLKKDDATSGKNRVRLTDGNGHAVVSLDWKGQPKRWLLTAYEEEAGTGTTMDTASNDFKGDTARLEPSTVPSVAQAEQGGKASLTKEEVIEAIRKKGSIEPRAISAWIDRFGIEGARTLVEGDYSRATVFNIVARDIKPNKALMDAISRDETITTYYEASPESIKALDAQAFSDLLQSDKDGYKDNASNQAYLVLRHSNKKAELGYVATLGRMNSERLYDSQMPGGKLNKMAQPYFAAQAAQESKPNQEAKPNNGAASGAVDGETQEANQVKTTAENPYPDRPAKWRGDMVQARIVAGRLGLKIAKNASPADIVKAIDAHDAKAAGKTQEAAPAAKKELPLTVGTMPNNAEAVTVKDGVVFIGEYEALDYDSGEPITVPKGSSREAVAKALKDAGALVGKMRIFGLGEQAGDVMYSRKKETLEERKKSLTGLRSNTSPVSNADIDALVARFNGRNGAVVGHGDGQAVVSRPTVVVARSWADMPAAVREHAAQAGYDNTNKSDRILGAQWHGKMYLVQENISSVQEAEETLLHERVHQVLRGNANDKGGVELRKALNQLYLRVGGGSGIAQLASQAGMDLKNIRKQAAHEDSNRRNALVMEEFLATLDGNRAYEQFPDKVKRALQEFVGAFRSWLRNSGFEGLANRLGANLDAATLSDLRYMLKGLRTQEAGTGSDAVRFLRVWHGTPHRGIEKTGFKLNKIGTGEGAQAYGWGIYFAGMRDTGESYRKNVSADAFQIGNTGETFDPDALEHLNVRSMTRRGDLDGAIKTAQEIAASDSPVADKAQRDLEKLQAVKDQGGLQERRGQLYSADIPETHELLDFDAPLSKQPEQVRAAIEKIRKATPKEMAWMLEGIDSSTSGKVLYGTLSDLAAEMNSDAEYSSTAQAGSELLLQYGIPGLRYLDGNSRADGEGTHNFVIWDESRLTPDAAKIEPMYSRSANTKAAYEARIAPLEEQIERARRVLADARAKGKQSAKKNKQKAGRIIADAEAKLTDDARKFLEQNPSVTSINELDTLISVNGNYLTNNISQWIYKIRKSITNPVVVGLGVDDNSTWDFVLRQIITNDKEGINAAKTITLAECGQNEDSSFFVRTKDGESTYQGEYLWAVVRDYFDGQKLFNPFDADKSVEEIISRP